jgi:hypothetical protein
MPATKPTEDSRLVPLLSVPLVVLLLLGGGWVTGGLITNDFTLSMVLTAAWVGAVGLACLLAFRRRRQMWPALAAFGVTAVVAGGYLASTTLFDDKVDEDVVRADAPATPREQPAPKTKPRSTPRPPANVLLAQGRFSSLEHDTTGVAKAIKVRDGRRVLTLTEFQTSNGPDLRVYLSAGTVNQGSSGDAYRELGKLKGNIGNQQYEIPRGLNLRRFKTVLIWCKAFSAGFGLAPLRQ